MDEQEYAAAELRAWERALREQREMEYDMLCAYRSGDRERLDELRVVVNGLRLRADLLLAEAVRVRHLLRQGLVSEWATSPPTGMLDPPLCNEQRSAERSRSARR